MGEFGLSVSDHYSSFSDDQLDNMVITIKNDMPTASYQMVRGRSVVVVFFHYILCVECYLLVHLLYRSYLCYCSELKSHLVINTRLSYLKVAFHGCSRAMDKNGCLNALSGFSWHPLRIGQSGLRCDKDLQCAGATLTYACRHQPQVDKVLVCFHRIFRRRKHNPFNVWVCSHQPQLVHTKFAHVNTCKLCCTPNLYQNWTNLVRLKWV